MPSSRVRPPRRPGAAAIRRILWSALLGLAALCCVDAASAQEWRYRVRPGDNVWDLAAKYLRNDVPWQKLQAHNDIPDPLRLPPGSQMRFPVAWLKQQPAKAKVVGVQGSAVARDAAGRESPVSEGMRLGIGATLRTAADANLTLEFADGSRLLLQGDSELVLDKLSAYGATGMTDTRLRLPRGRAGNAVRPMRGPAANYIIATPHTISSVRGTRFRIGSDGTRSQSEVTEGKVAVSGGGGQVLLKPGQGTASGSDNRPLPPRALLAAPEPASIALSLDQIPARLTWKPVPGAARYRVQVSATPEFVTLLHDRVADAPQDALPALADGTYSVRVRAIDENGIEGLDATVSLRAARQPPFAIAPSEGSSTDAERPRFRWASMGEGVRYRFQLAGAAGFDAPLADQTVKSTDLRSPQALTPGDYQWRVAAIDSEDRATGFSEGQHFSVRAPGPGPELQSGSGAADKRTLQVRWPAGAEGQRFRFQLSRKADFSRLEVDRELDDNQITLPGMRSGTWYARIQTIDSDGYAGPYGPTQTIKMGCLSCRIAAIGGGVVLVLLAL
ncbi:FecR domain-containing protein [Luteimonas aquatica]|uniref:FecR domain-containing protein n=1 Tax=Luteimonas aquatica TaxID=450364 RepID=UPI001F55D7E1|nr:FecR domain-containing protein [Luteimonas aquatica]